MEREEVENLVKLRTYLINQFNRCKDYKNNNNAIMKEEIHARVIHNTVTNIDKILEKYVKFDTK